VDGLEPVGRSLLLIGLVVAAIGVVLILAPRIPILGKLPGDITFQRDGVTVVIPLATMLVVSLVLTIVLNQIGRGR
jgi:Protein of unknown function (DUF2905)